MNSTDHTDEVAVTTLNVRCCLGSLADPHRYRAPIDTAGFAREDLLRYYRSLLLIRRFEERVGELVERGEARCPCHLAIGQEAIAVGVAAVLTPADRVFGGHRSHAHYLAMGGDVFGLFAEILGKAEGCARGMGGSMHICAPEVGFHGSVPIVGATIPIAVGAALAAKLDRRRFGRDPMRIGVCFFGDGATEEGVLHESLNLAAVLKLPVLFVCENNLFSSHLDIKLRQPYDRVARFAEVHGVKTRTVDGNDVAAVACAARELVASVRQGQGPAFLEAVTYRWRGHVGPKEDIDVGLRRSMSDLRAWRERDPIRRLENALIGTGMATRKELMCISREVEEQLDQAERRALEADYPSPDALMDLVFSEPGQGEDDV